MLLLQVVRQGEQAVEGPVQDLVNIHHSRHHFLEIHLGLFVEQAYFAADLGLQAGGRSTYSTHGVMQVECSLEGGESNGWHGTTTQLNFLLEQ